MGDFSIFTGGGSIPGLIFYEGGELGSKVLYLRVLEGLPLAKRAILAEFVKMLDFGHFDAKMANFGGKMVVQIWRKFGHFRWNDLKFLDHFWQNGQIWEIDQKWSFLDFFGKSLVVSRGFWPTLVVLPGSNLVILAKSGRA